METDPKEKDRMEKDLSRATGTVKLIAFALLAFAITTLAGGIWAGLLITNLRTTPAVPWSVPAMSLLLWLAWSYLGGKGWPRSTSEARQHYLRANPNPVRVYLWAWIAGGLAVIALAGYWIALFQLVKMPPNALSDVSAYPRFRVGLMILMGSLVAPLMEEAGFRGYFQVALERHLRAPLAIAISSLIFALAHGPTQGFLWPKLLFYFLVGVTFGATAYLTNSILPAIPVHFVGLLIFFTLIWPQDAARPLIANAGPDKWFWIHIAQAILFTPPSLWAFRHLARLNVTADILFAKADSKVSSRTDGIVV
jgi:membrane protease YdiL (CAAX protease family)